MQPSRDSQSVTVMALLSVAPARKICFSPLAATVTLLVATNFEDFWSIFMMSMSGMLRWKTLSLISWRNCDLRSAQRDLVITGLDLLTTRREYFILWYNDQTHDLVTLKSIYFLNLFGFLQTNPFSTPETTWMLIPAPAVRRFSSIERNLRSSTSSISNGRFLTLLIVDCSLVSPFFFCSCMDFFFGFLPMDCAVLLVKLAEVWLDFSDSLCYSKGCRMLCDFLLVFLSSNSLFFLFLPRDF